MQLCKCFRLYAAPVDARGHLVIVLSVGCGNRYHGVVLVLAYVAFITTYVLLFGIKAAGD